MKLRLALAGLLSLTTVAAIAQTHSEPKTPLPPQTPVVTFGEAGKHQVMLKDFMRYVINPDAEEFWQWGGEVDGVLRTPTNDKEWYAALQAAVGLLDTSTSKIFYDDPRAKSDPNWLKWVADMNKAAADGVKATQAKNGPATFEAGSDVFAACTACHYKYIQRVPQKMLPLPDIPDDFFKKPAS